MYNLLIVDDEPIIADSLAHMLQETQGDRFAVYEAYSGREAAEIFEKRRIDLLITDIRMPDIDGLQLKDIVVKDWPYCRIIFLTGHNEFEYTRKAIDPATVSYILKSEGDDAVLDAIDKACERLEQEYSQMSKRMSRIKIAEPLISTEILKALTFPSEIKNMQNIKEMLSTLDDPIDIGKPMLMAVGALDIHWDATVTGRIQTIVEKTLEVRYKTMSAVLPSNTFVLLMQDRGGVSRTSHCKGLLEIALNLCTQSTVAKELSFFLEDKPLDADMLAPVYNMLIQKRLQMKGNPGVQLIKSELNERKEANDVSVIEAFQIENVMNCLSTGQTEQYFQIVNELIAKFRNREMLAGLILYSTLSSLLMNAISHHLPQGNSLQDEDTMYRLGNYYIHPNFADAMKYLEEIAKNYFALIKEMGDNSADLVVREINTYIAEHLDGDLSLTKLADRVGLHPSYLSRLYKETANIPLSSYIVKMRIAASCDMLENTKEKTNDIAKAIGLNTASYFTNFFKKHMGITPQEYRLTLKRK